MFHKYTKLILLATLLLQASPKAYNSLGTELEAIKEDCKIYQGFSSLPDKIKKECNQFKIKLNKAFNVGYTLDPYVDSDNINEEKLNKYLNLLLRLDKTKDDILNLVYAEAKKARKQNNFKIYSQLISNNKVKLYTSDYEFMEKNKDVFSKNRRYLSHMQHLKDLEEQRKNQQKVEDQVETKKSQRNQIQTYKRVRKPTYNAHSIIMNNCTNKWGTNYKMIKYCVDKQSKAKSIVLSTPNNTIKVNCEKKWGTNYSMIKYCVDKQSKAKSIVTSDNCQNLWGAEQRQCLDNQRKTKRALSEIQSNELNAMAKCRKKWGNDYSMVKYCAENHGRLNQVTSSMSTDTSIMVRCKKKWGTNYSMVKYCVENQSESYKEISSIVDIGRATKQDKCKNKWGTDYNTCISEQIKREKELSPRVDKCKKKWGTNYRMVKYCIDK